MNMIKVICILWACGVLFTNTIKWIDDIGAIIGLLFILLIYTIIKED